MEILSSLALNYVALSYAQADETSTRKKVFYFILLFIIIKYIQLVTNDDDNKQILVGIFLLNNIIDFDYLPSKHGLSQAVWRSTSRRN